MLHCSIRNERVVSMENNTTLLNEETSCLQPTDPVGVKLGKTLGLSIIMFSSLVGNLLVILVFERNLTTRTNTNYFVVNMAVSDLLFPLIVWPAKTNEFWSEPGRWFLGGPVGQFSCKFIYFLQDVSTAVSIQSLVLIAVERFIAVVFPMKVRNFTPRSRTISVIVTWLVATALHSPYFYFFKLSTRCDKFYCIMDRESSLDYQMTAKIYVTALILILIFIPLTLIFILYTSISLVLRKRKALANHLGDEANTRRGKQNRKITRMSICIVVTFAFCFLPLFVCGFVLFYSNVSSDFLHHFSLVFHFLVYANSAINPWILFYFSQNFRQGLRNMCGCCPCVSETLNLCCTRRQMRRENNQAEVELLEIPRNEVGQKCQSLLL